jgi:predicted NUDIX family NTP pyrophosphohydrolase
MGQRSACLLLYRRCIAAPEFFLLDPVGSFWTKKNVVAWSIPKGPWREDEQPLEAAKRVFAEETGSSGSGEFIPLGEFPQASRKIVSAWMVEADCDAATIKNNLFAMEWSPKSGRRAEFLEGDRAAFAPSAFASLASLLRPEQHRFYAARFIERRANCTPNIGPCGAGLRLLVAPPRYFRDSMLLRRCAFSPAPRTITRQIPAG